MEDDCHLVTITDLIAFVRRHLIALLIAAYLAGVSVFYASTLLPRTFEARSIVLAAQTNPELRSFGVGMMTAVPLDVSVYRAATLTPDVLEDARARAQAAGLTDIPGIATLRGALSIATESRGTSSLMTIAVRHEDRMAATVVADAVASAAVAWDRRRARMATATATATALRMARRSLRDGGSGADATSRQTTPPSGARGINGTRSVLAPLYPARAPQPPRRA